MPPRVDSCAPHLHDPLDFSVLLDEKNSRLLRRVNQFHDEEIPLGWLRSRPFNRPDHRTCQDLQNRAKSYST